MINLFLGFGYAMNLIASEGEVMKKYVSYKQKSKKGSRTENSSFGFSFTYEMFFNRDISHHVTS